MVYIHTGTHYAHIYLQVVLMQLHILTGDTYATPLHDSKIVAALGLTAIRMILEYAR